jgi:hypothetical protein
MTEGNISHQIMSPIRGYLEGYYGKLLSWDERHELVQSLTSLKLSTYCYAPKEDPLHRLHWREPYSRQWLSSFAQFCTFAGTRSVSVAAGIAPGLDYNFDPPHASSDFNHLRCKADQLIVQGANDILILWDDIEESYLADKKNVSEGAAHAAVINELGASLGRALWSVPRVYAADIENKNNYLREFFSELESQHTVLMCGDATVATSVSSNDLLKLTRITPSDKAPKHRIVVWDNFYANDYCPRRLFMGPWTGRKQIDDYLINPTGMPNTDKLLLDITCSTHKSDEKKAAWTQALQRHGVPDSFLAIAPYFCAPFFGDREIIGNKDDVDCSTTQIDVGKGAIAQAIEDCLWKWKSPLAREWYPFIFGLKHDLALVNSELPRDRILKTQTPSLSNHILCKSND